MHRLCCGLTLLFLLPACSPQSLFYYPNRILYHDPAELKINSHIVQYPSLNGKILYGVYFETSQKPLGTIVHFHGNYGNVSNHFPLALFLVKAGFDVLSFDYEGYGASEGRPTPDHTIADGIATVRYAQAHLRDGASGVAVFGQSLGGSIAIVVAAREPLVKGIVSEAAFSAYREMARDVLKRHIWLWPMEPVLPLFMNSRDAPIRFIGNISPRPILIIHGDQDKIVSVRMAYELFDHAREPKKLWIVPGAGHLQCSHVASEHYEQTISDFFKSALTNTYSR